MITQIYTNRQNRSLNRPLSKNNYFHGAQIIFTILDVGFCVQTQCKPQLELSSANHVKDSITCMLQTSLNLARPDAVPKAQRLTYVSIILYLFRISGQILFFKFKIFMIYSNIFHHIVICVHNLMFLVWKEL